MALDMKTAMDWYGSPEYQALLQLRTNNVITDLVLVDRVGPDVTWAEWTWEMQAVIAATPGAAN
jgi:hypothetical protein